MTLFKNGRTPPYMEDEDAASWTTEKIWYAARQMSWPGLIAMAALAMLLARRLGLSPRWVCDAVREL